MTTQISAASQPDRWQEGVTADLSPVSVPVGGFGLKSLQIYNWGTYHDRVWVMPTDGQGCLLTGANGSGKSTVVDALLTLLVPNKKRNYNLSSGSERRERNEASYVRGAYQKEQVKSSTVQAKYLRSDKTLSGLCAQFVNGKTGQSLSLLQFFWNDIDSLKKIYAISHTDVSLAAMLEQAKSPKDLKRVLTNHGNTFIFQSFGEYADYFVHFFGFRSSKGLELFNQITSIKQIGELSDFVRQHMLDGIESQDILDQLYKNYDDLSASHRAILLAKSQLSELTVIEKEAKQWQKLSHHRELMKDCRDFALVYLTERKAHLVSEACSRIREELAAVEARLVKADHEIAAKQTELNSAKSLSAGSGLQSELSQIDLQISHVRDQLRECDKRYDAYRAQAVLLGGSTPVSPIAFSRNAELALKVLESSRSDLAAAQERLFQHRLEVTKKQTALDEIEREITACLQSKSRIPQALLAVRQELCEKLGIQTKDAPFVAELIKVSDSEVRWTGAIERVFGAFSLRILVSQDNFKAAAQFLKSRHFGTRIAILQASDKRSAHTVSDGSKLLDKLTFKDARPVTQWLKAKISRDYAYSCCDDLKAFHKEDFALTVEGLVRRGSHSLEKDDRFSITDTKRFVLGWDHMERAQELQKEKGFLVSEITRLSHTGQDLSRDIFNITQKIETAEKLKSFDSFEEIDVRHCHDRLAELDERRTALCRKDSTFKDFSQQISNLTGELVRLRIERDHALQAVALMRSQAEALQSEFTSSTSLLATLQQPSPEHRALLLKTLQDMNLSLTVDDPKRIDQIHQEASSQLAQALDAASKSLEEKAQTLVRRMTQFKATYPEQSSNLDGSIEYLSGFIAVKAKLESESLPEHELRFKNLLGKSTINDMTSFKSTLEMGYEKIEEDIAGLNESLKHIDYGNGTYVRIVMSRTKDQDVRDFLSALKACIRPLSHDDQSAELEDIFHRVKTVLDKLKRDERWASAVTDVRNWATFLVEECQREDDVPRNVYSDSAGLSGGQKAKLAFTILGSALAYQYGIHRDSAADKSFRFLVIDEAFSKSDDKNAKYALELFRRLGLQLMVVTPFDKVSLIEPYVKNIFVAHMDESKNTSMIAPIAFKQLTPSAAALQ